MLEVFAIRTPYTCKDGSFGADYRARDGTIVINESIEKLDGMDRLSTFFFILNHELYHARKRPTAIMIAYTKMYLFGKRHKSLMWTGILSCLVSVGLMFAMVAAVIVSGGAFPAVGGMSIALAFDMGGAVLLVPRSCYEIEESRANAFGKKNLAGINEKAWKRAEKNHVSSMTRSFKLGDIIRKRMACKQCGKKVTCWKEHHAPDDSAPRDFQPSGLHAKE